MGWKRVFGFLFAFMALLLLVLYWFIPLSKTEYGVKFNPNLSESINKSDLQFYSDMRFQNSDISYRISKCPLKRTNDMQDAFEDISQLTALSFHPVASNEEITITCDSSDKIEDGLFIAGEGGPTNITKSGSFNIISHGQILLLKDSNCPSPNVAIHELLHVLGFDHIQDENSIMYPVSNCDQEIDSVIIDSINEIYSVPSYPDLTFERVDATLNGKYLDLNFSVRNVGIASSPQSKIFVFSDDSVIKEIELDSLSAGHGRIITLTNVWIPKLTIDNLKIRIIADFSELKKENNEALLEVKNKN